MISLSVFTAVFVVLAILSPFFYGKGGKLAQASSIQSKDQLMQIQTAILNRFLTEEMAYEKKEISQRAWRSRREFLIKKYVDTARRLDHLSGAENEAAHATS